MKHLITEIAKLKSAFEFFALTICITILILIFVGSWFDIEPEIITFVDLIMMGES